ncbi:hypothetical protein BH11MYX1_BH11MYX1_15900 [soil metagenome]
MKEPTRNMRILDALADHAAHLELEFGASTKESRAAAARYAAFASDRLAEKRRQDLEQVHVQTERRPIRKSLLAMGRDALLAQLAKLEAGSPALAFAHQDLTHVSDDDLRTMVDDADRAMEQDRDVTR